MRTINLVVVAWLIILITTEKSIAQKQQLTAQRVAEAIEKCAGFLESNQVKNGPLRGSWAGHEENGCGQTSLVTLALLSAGKTAESPKVKLALSHIRGVQSLTTYEAALQLMVLCMAEPRKDAAKIQEVTSWLVKGQSANGGWGYGRQIGDSDESNTQFAVLALWEASKLGVAIPAECFKKCEGYWRDQVRGEGWGYRGKDTLGSMTCAGIASMLILQDAFEGADASAAGNALRCCGSGANQMVNLEIPLKWLANHFSVTQNPNQPANLYKMYYLYALERVGRLTGQRFFIDQQGNKHDWYREGADHLLSIQTIAGSIPGGGSEPDAVTSTAMALLFLSKGKRQVVIGHLQYGRDSETDWNRHRRSIQNLTGQIEKVWKRELAWQTVPLEKATLETLLETPVLFISGSKEFVLTPAQRKLLKDYAEQSGFIFAEACNGDGCDGQAFDRSFKREMEAIFGKPLQKLPPSHPIWTAEAKVDPNGMPKDFWLYGLDACCRTSVVYSPISLSCRWELDRPWGIGSKRNASIDADITNATKVGVNVAAYATGRELKDKLDNVLIITPQTNRQSLTRGSLTVGKIMHTGGADDTPKALSNLLEVYRNTLMTPTENKTPMISLASDEVEKYPILYIHGRSRFAFTDEERRGLKNHFENGGFVIGDAICASKEFADSVRKEFSHTLPDSEWRKLDPKHPLMQMNDPAWQDWSDVVLIDAGTGGTDLKQSSRRAPADIDSLEWKGRIVMLFSPNDLSCAMESKHSMQCRGYVRNDSFKIGINMILSAISQDVFDKR
ncbi:MAG: DUF4159 domain-containing protein [Pirellula sp.]